MRPATLAARTRSARSCAGVGKVPSSGLWPRWKAEKASPATRPLKSGTATGRLAAAHSAKATAAQASRASSVAGSVQRRATGGAGWVIRATPCGAGGAGP